MKNTFLYLIIIVLYGCGSADSKDQVTQDNPILPPEWESISSPTKAHLRGLDVTMDGTIWASGTMGSVLKSTDNGLTWNASQIPDCSEIDFRDIEGFDATHAVVMSSGNGVRLYHTSDGGGTWALSFEDTNSAIFFDGMDFYGGRGMAYGDPQNGSFDILQSSDSGRSWTRGLANMPATLDGEAGFAASGTGIVLGKSAIWIATGGAAKSRIFRVGADSSWSAVNSPLLSAPSSGIFSMAFWDDINGVVVGGDYVDSTRMTENCAYTNDGGKSWNECELNTTGYRSCVTFVNANTVIATGRSGSDISYDGGVNWIELSDQAYYSCAAIGNWVIGTGRSGKIGRLKLNPNQLSVND